MPKSTKHLIIGSTEAHSGKSTASVAIALQLQAMGLQVGWGKPLASVEGVTASSDGIDVDLNFVPDILSLSPEQRSPTLVSLNSHPLSEQLGQNLLDSLSNALARYWEHADGDIVLLEGPSTLEEGASLNLSLPEITTALDASVLLVMQFNTRYMIDQVMSAQKRLGHALMGVILNGIDPSDAAVAADTIVPYLENQGIPVLATLPQLPFLRGMRVSELAGRLEAEVLCCADHQDLVVESLKIGAMNVNAALRFFSQGVHQAVVTGGDRRDLQIAALETSTHCLILTGQIAPAEDVLALAQDKEVPVLSVATDTLTTVERIDSLFGRTPLNNPDKIPFIEELLASKIDMTRLISLLGIEAQALAPRS